MEIENFTSYIGYWTLEIGHIWRIDKLGAWVIDIEDCILNFLKLKLFIANNNKNKKKLYIQTLT